MDPPATGPTFLCISLGSSLWRSHSLTPRLPSFLPIYQSLLLICLPFSFLALVAFLIKLAIQFYFSLAVSIVATRLSLKRRVSPTSATTRLRSGSWARHWNRVWYPSPCFFAQKRQYPLGLCRLLTKYCQKHPWLLRPCASEYFIEPCSQRTHSLTLGIRVRMHLPFFRCPCQCCIELDRLCDS